MGFTPHRISRLAQRSQCGRAVTTSAEKIDGVDSRRHGCARRVRSSCREGGLWLRAAIRPSIGRPPGPRAASAGRRDVADRVRPSRITCIRGETKTGRPRLARRQVGAACFRTGDPLSPALSGDGRVAETRIDLVADRRRVGGRLARRGGIRGGGRRRLDLGGRRWESAEPDAEAIHERA